MSMNVFNSSGTAFLGPQPFAFDRSKMLAGLPATFVTTVVTGGSVRAFLPADLDGSTLPARGSAGDVRQLPGRRHVPKFTTSMLICDAGELDIHVICQSGSGGIYLALSEQLEPAYRNSADVYHKLDGIGDRLMFRLAYRNFGDHESVVGNLHGQRRRRRRHSLV